jgi:hypothetical protein
VHLRIFPHFKQNGSGTSHATSSQTFNLIFSRVSNTILKLPADLEVMLQETDDDDGFDVASVLQHRVELPMNVISLSTDSFMPYDQGIRFEHYVSDPLVLISTIPRHSDTKMSCLDAKINICPFLNKYTYDNFSIDVYVCVDITNIVLYHISFYILHTR